jgi:hypothetical protein
MAHLDRMLGEASASGYPYATQVIEFNRQQIQRELEWIEELSRHIEEGKR